eukprot:6498392-Prymnesium_polylepis.2
MTTSSSNTAADDSTSLRLVPPVFGRCANSIGVARVARSRIVAATLRAPDDFAQCGSIMSWRPTLSWPTPCAIAPPFIQRLLHDALRAKLTTL